MFLVLQQSTHPIHNYPAQDIGKLGDYLKLLQQEFFMPDKPVQMTLLQQERALFVQLLDSIHRQTDQVNFYIFNNYTIFPGTS